MLGLALARKSAPPPFDMVAQARAIVTGFIEAWPEPELEAGDQLGRFKLTYYWLSSETGGRRAVRLYNKKCRKLARVSRKFARQLRMEGGGRLRDGRVLLYAGRCRCSRSPCYQVAARGHAWGTGKSRRPLNPFRSVAVDPRHVAIGKALYIPELDGLTMPGLPPWGGFVHDGCVTADDTGGNVRGRQIDFFAAHKNHYSSLARRHRLKKVTVFDGGERCRAPARPTVSRRGST